MRSFGDRAVDGDEVADPRIGLVEHEGDGPAGHAGVGVHRQGERRAGRADDDAVPGPEAETVDVGGVHPGDGAGRQPGQMRSWPGRACPGRRACGWRPGGRSRRRAVGPWTGRGAANDSSSGHRDGAGPSGVGRRRRRDLGLGRPPRSPRRSRRASSVGSSDSASVAVDGRRARRDVGEREQHAVRRCARPRSTSRPRWDGAIRPISARISAARREPELGAQAQGQLRRRASSRGGRCREA